jgi:hypothetical protein
MMKLLLGYHGVGDEKNRSQFEVNPGLEEGKGGLATNSPQEQLRADCGDCVS